MRYSKHFVLLFLLFAGVAAQAQIITTVAGNGRFGFSGDGSAATDAQLYNPMGIAVDDSGNLYIADVINNCVRKVGRAGIITTFAGSGEVAITGAYSGDGGAATDAKLYWPEGIAIDHHGNILIADAVNGRIRKVNAAGIISTIAGSDSVGYSGDGGPATAARLRYSCDVAVDRYNNIYIADGSNNRIRKVDTNGIITTVAGNGIYASADSGAYTGDGGPATAAALYHPQSLTLDTNGNIFIADMMNNCVRRVAANGIITTYAGNGYLGYGSDRIPATNSMMINPSGVAFDKQGNLYIADGGTNRIRKVSPAGIITTAAGTGRGGYSGDGGHDTSAQLFSPSSVTLDKVGNIYIADAANYRVRMISAAPSGISTRNIPSGICIYPNPSSSSFTLNIGAVNNADVHVCITNMAGQTIKDLQAPANKDVSVQLNVPAGIYTISAYIEGGVVVRKLVVGR